ncbi:MAG: transglycosylase SLT domain-containing protein, partial [Firmicutes bacterium]|nr:transglycosylase SLT domain-containing protein [Bacillota bacterium]
LKQSLSQAQMQLGSTQEQMAQINASIKQTQTLIQNTEAQYAAMQNQYSAASAQYQSMVSQYNKTQADISQQSQLLAGQLQLIEERGSIGYLSVLLGAHSFGDFITRAAMLGQVASSAAQAVQTLKTDEAALAVQKSQMAQQVKLLAQAKDQMAQRQTVLASEKAALQSEYQQSQALHQQAEYTAQSDNGSIAANAQEVQALQNQQKQISGNINALGSQLSQIVSQIQSLLAQYNTGSISQEGLYNAMLPLVQPIAAQENLPPALVIAVITEESGGNPDAVSPAGAIGLMQLEPQTAKDLGISPSELYNPQENLVAGCMYLRDMLNMFQNSLSLALSAYNAGPGAVEENGDQVVPATMGYVDNIEALYQQYTAYGAS